MLPETPNQRADVDTHGAERGLGRFEGFSDAFFAIALTDPRLVLPPPHGLRARRIGDPGRRPRPDRLHLDGEVVLRNAGPAGDGGTAGARFPPADDAPLRRRDADPDRRSSGRDRGAARRSGNRAAVRRLLPAAAAQAAL